MRRASAALAGLPSISPLTTTAQYSLSGLRPHGQCLHLRQLLRVAYGLLSGQRRFVDLHRAYGKVDSCLA